MRHICSFYKLTLINEQYSDFAWKQNTAINTTNNQQLIAVVPVVTQMAHPLAKYGTPLCNQCFDVIKSIINTYNKRSEKRRLFKVTVITFGEDVNLI